MNTSEKVSQKGSVRPPKANDDKFSRRKLLLRTCFRIWNQTTFGRVSPSKARKHHRRKVLKHCMMTWKNSHLPSRIDWKMQIRAEYHDRFRLWQKCISAWKDFVVLNKENKEVKLVADQHANKHLLKKCLASMKRFVELERAKKSVNQIAINFHRKTIQKRTWEIWIYSFNNQCLLKDMDYLALQHWAQTILLKVFIKWQNTFMDRCDEKKRIVYSEVHYNTSLVRKVVVSWLIYIKMRREKKSKKDLAALKYKQNLLDNSFGKWRRSHHLLMLVKEYEMMIVFKGNMAIKRRYFLRLMMYHQQKLFYQQLSNDAAELHNRKIKDIYFQRMKLAIKLEIERKKNKEEAGEFYARKLLLKYFMNWMMKCESKEDLKLIPLTRIAYRYYRIKQLTMVIFQWKQYVREEQREKQLWHLAELHHNSKILPKCLTSWKLFKEIRLEISQLKDMAMEFNRELIHSKYFYTWVKEYNVSTNEASMEVLAVDHYNASVVKMYFVSWKKCNERKLAKKSLQSKSYQFYCKRILLSALRTWKSVYQDHSSSLDKMVTANHLYHKKIKGRCWNAFREFYQRKKQKHLKELNADTFYKKKVYSIVMVSWKRYVGEQMIIHEKVSCVCAERNEIICRWVLETWKQFTEEEKELKKDCQKAETHFLYTLKYRAFISLKQYSIKRIEKRFNEDEAVIRGQIRLEKSYLRKIFTKWRESAMELFEQKDKMAIALNHYDKVLQKKSIESWKQFVCHTLRMKIFRSRAMLFCIKKVEDIHFQRWKSKYQMILAENQKSNIAIWWWSYQLRRKVFRAIIRYTSNQREKRKDYSAALVFRKNLLLEKGVVNWIQYASHSMNRRRDIAYKEQVKKTMELQARVHKYALIWLRKTRAGKSMPKHTNILHTSDVKSSEVLTNVAPCITSPLKRCKTFDVKYPEVKSRPPPRLPDYLRESFELSKFKETNMNTSYGNQRMKSVQTDKRKCHFNVEEDISPRTFNIMDMYSPVNHPMARSFSESMKCLEVTDDMNLEKSVSVEKETVLLPPSKFSKVC